MKSGFELKLSQSRLHALITYELYFKIIVLGDLVRQGGKG